MNCRRGAIDLSLGVRTEFRPPIEAEPLNDLVFTQPGVLAIIAAITGGTPAPRWWLAIVGLLGIAAGLLTFLMPGLSAIVLLFFIAGWAIASGVFQIIGAVKLRKEIDNEWLLIFKRCDFGAVWRRRDVGSRRRRAG
jgi:hypothetical protein